MSNWKDNEEKKLMDEIAEILAVQSNQSLVVSNQMDKNKSILESTGKEFEDIIKLQGKLLDSLEDNEVIDSDLMDDIDKILSKETLKLDTTIINTVDCSDGDWESLVNNNRSFAMENNIDIVNPYKSMFSNSERAYLNRELIDKFQICQLDKMDYAFATACGLVAGIIDACMVGTITQNSSDSILQSKVDDIYEKVVGKYAKHEKIGLIEKNRKAALSAHPENAKIINEKFNNLVEDARNMDIKQSISFLENNHKVSYDVSTFAKGTKESEIFAGVNPSNHHLFSVAHDSGILGLLVGIIDQIRGTATMIVPSTGKWIPVKTTNMQADLGNSLPEKIINAISNWFGHRMSDIAGSKSSKGRGAGLPFPGFESLQALHFGKFPINGQDKDFAQMTEWMYINGYDARSFNAQLIPVLINETLVRIYWFVKQHYYYGKSVKESIPVANNRELSRLLLVAASAFSAVDVGHAVIKSGGADLSTFIMTINIPGLVDFGFRCVQNIRFEIQHRKHVEKIIDEDIRNEWRRIYYSAE